MTSGTDFLKDCLAGGVAAAISETATAPVERVKLLLQLQNMSKQIRPEERYKGILDCLTRIPKEQGFLSFWRGHSMNVIRGFPVQAFNFGFKDQLRILYLQGVDLHTHFWQYFAGNLAAGGTAGVLTLTIVYPLDYIRTRVAVDVGLGKPSKSIKKILPSVHAKTREFEGLWDCVRKTMKTDGIRGFYQGYAISVIGIALYRACYFGFYDTAKGTFLSDIQKPPFWLKWIVAQSTVAYAGFISFPLDTIRRRMMMQAGEDKSVRKYKNARDLVRKVWKEEGIRSLYTGAVANMFRSVGGALVLILYDEFQSSWR